MTTLQILVSTHNNRIVEVLSLLRSVADSDVQIVIEHQVTETLNPDAEKVVERIRAHARCHYRQSNETGLAKSRNALLQRATADICLMADTDITYQAGFAQTVRRAFRELPRADIICFGIMDRSWFGRRRQLGWAHIGRVSSVGIAFRRQSIRQAQLAFDVRYGIGAAVPQGEENIFLADALRAGLSVWAWPAKLAAHPHVSEGERSFDPRVKTAVAYRMRGWWYAALKITWYTLTKSRYYHKQYNPFTFLAAGLRVCWRLARDKSVPSA